MNSTASQQAIDTVIGHRVKAAISSLENMSLEMDGGGGLLIKACENGGKPAVSIEHMPSEQLPRQPDAVCSVDWSWIQGSALDKAVVNDASVRLHLDPAGPLTVSVQFWQGKPFLAFQPYKPAK